MYRESKSHSLPTIQHPLVYLVVLAIVGMLGHLSLRFDQQWDWSAGDRNSLSPASQKVMSKLRGALQITSFAPEHRELRHKIKTVIEPYLRASPETTFTFINPAMQPARVRELGIKASGELHIQYQNRWENLRDLNETAITNAIQRLLGKNDRWIVNLLGHGERSLLGNANYDMGEFGKALKQAGYPLSTLNLSKTPTIPNNTQVLLIAGPQSNYLSGQLETLQSYIAQGGNLLWLMEPEQPESLKKIAEQLKISWLPGTVVDASGAKLGLDSPAIVPVSQFPEHPATAELNQLSLFPHALALQPAKGAWKVATLLQTHDKSWNETSPVKGELSINPELWETPGPLSIGIGLTREVSDREQRIVVIGDGDFLSNTYLGNAGNLQLGLNLLRWLAEDDQLLDIPAYVAADQQIILDDKTRAALGIWFLAGMPIVLAIVGVILVRKRRRN